MMDELNLLYVHSKGMGYGRLGMNLADHLAKRGIDIYDEIPNPKRGEMKTSERLLLLGEHPDTIKRWEQGTSEKVCGTVCWVSVPTHAAGWWEGQRVTMFTMFEASRLPESFRETFHNFERLLVPSKQNVELFSQYHDNVRYVPLGVDPVDWHYTERKPPGPFFNFLIGGSGKRKGVDLTYEAFHKVFPKTPKTGPIPRLILKNPRGENWELSDRVEMITGKISQEDEISLYAAAHCYVQPSRGEGFGFQPLQAIAQGLPTILTNAHGHESFAHLGLPLDWKFDDAGYFIFGQAPDRDGKPMQWWEPDFEQLCEYMHDVYNDYETHLEYAEQSAVTVAKEFTWANVAENFLREIGDLGPYDGPMVWHEPEIKKFRTRVNRPYACEIAGEHLQMLPGRDYWLIADVKRVLFEAGILDPECLGDDDGLTPEQVTRVEEYSATHGSCQLCGQPLGGKTRADEIFEDLQAKSRVEQMLI